MADSQIRIYYSRLTINNETSYLAATEQGLLWTGAFNEGFQDLIDWLDKKFRNYILEENEDMLKIYINQFKEYFQGKRECFNFPLILQGTPFQKAVWKSLQQIPYGETRTYTEIAQDIGNPKSVRAVGTAIGKNPILFAVPCHRVINKNGSLGGFRGGIELKSALLHLEK